jgi:hypothetical protein
MAKKRWDIGEEERKAILNKILNDDEERKLKVNELTKELNNIENQGDMRDVTRILAIIDILNDIDPPPTDFEYTIECSDKNKNIQNKQIIFS